MIFDRGRLKINFAAATTLQADDDSPVPVILIGEVEPVMGAPALLTPERRCAEKPPEKRKVSYTQRVFQFLTPRLV